MKFLFLSWKLKKPSYLTRTPPLLSEHSTSISQKAGSVWVLTLLSAFTRWAPASNLQNFKHWSLQKYNIAEYFTQNENAFWKIFVIIISCWTSPPFSSVLSCPGSSLPTLGRNHSLPHPNSIHNQFIILVYCRTKMIFQGRGWGAGSHCFWWRCCQGDGSSTGTLAGSTSINKIESTNILTNNNI